MPKIKTIIFPNTITKIVGMGGDNSKNPTLQKVVLPNKLVEIGDYSFSETKISNITIPESVTSIGYGTFRGCENLSSIKIPNSVTSIEEFAFWFCTSLTTVNYKGTEEQWNQITIGSDNTPLTNATINYNYTGK